MKIIIINIILRTQIQKKLAAVIHQTVILLKINNNNNNNKNLSKNKMKVRMKNYQIIVILIQMKKIMIIVQENFDCIFNN